MPDSVPMTQDGYDNLRQELDELQGKVPGIKKAVQEAREKGDLSENADYHAAREQLAMVNAKIASVQGKLAHAQVVDTSKAPTGSVVFGSTVTVRRVDSGKEYVRTLVGEGEADPSSGKILTTSPVGQALIGAVVGDVVTAELPAGAVEFEVLEIS